MCLFFAGRLPGTCAHLTQPNWLLRVRTFHFDIRHAKQMVCAIAVPPPHTTYLLSSFASEQRNRARRSNTIWYDLENWYAPRVQILTRQWKSIPFYARKPLSTPAISSLISVQLFLVGILRAYVPLILLHFVRLWFRRLRICYVWPRRHWLLCNQCRRSEVVSFHLNCSLPARKPLSFNMGFERGQYEVTLTCSLLKPSLITLVFDADTIRFSSNLTVSVEFKWLLVMERSPAATHGNCVACNSSSNSLVGVSSGNVTRGSSASSSSPSTMFSSDDLNLICNWLSADGLDSFNSLPIVGWVRLIVANSDIEFFMSFKSRFNAIALISDVDDNDDDVDEDIWCKRCDDDVFATRDVVVLDLVDDVLLLFRTWVCEHAKCKSKKFKN